MSVVQHHADQIVAVMKRMEWLYVHVKMNTSEHRPTVNQNVLLTVNAHKIKRAINSNARIHVLEHAVLEQVSVALYSAFLSNWKAENDFILFFRVPSYKP